MVEVGYSELLRLWGIQESLLQAYRRLFLTVETVLFSVSFAVIVNLMRASDELFLVPLLISEAFIVVAGVGAAGLWASITTRRAVAVNFCQRLVRVHEGVVGDASIVKSDNGKIINPLKQLDEHMSSFSDNNKLEAKEGSTRAVMELLPSMFMCFWIVHCILVCTISVVMG